MSNREVSATYNRSSATMKLYMPLTAQQLTRVCAAASGEDLDQEQRQDLLELFRRQVRRATVDDDAARVVTVDQNRIVSISWSQQSESCLEAM